ncbi:redox-sensing transcriptional repressor Rex [candidate division KSB1 bacterium]|nr:redox-sensing transcriptional repressor Rex [candidate division KSB1 bacterium]
MPISEKSLERLILYRRVLLNLQDSQLRQVFSHQLSMLLGFSSTQIRRDFMALGYSGSPIHGYDLEALLKSLSEFLDAPVKQGVALVGLGHLGRAIIDYFQGRRPRLEISATFDRDPQQVGRIIHGCHCYHIQDLKKIIQNLKILVAIIAIPADEAQEIADLLVQAGIKGILNYAPITLKVPPDVYVENRDMILAVEKVAYQARWKQSNSTPAGIATF